MTEIQKIKHSNVFVLSVKFLTPCDFDIQTKNKVSVIPSKFIQTTLPPSQSNKNSGKKKGEDTEALEQTYIRVKL